MDEGLSFEEALERLEKIVQALEQSGLKLEEAVALFEEGMGLLRVCSQRLDAADLKVSQLSAPPDQELESEGESD